jgi:hypothetical protein
MYYENGSRKARPLRSRSRIGGAANRLRVMAVLMLIAGMIATGGFGFFPSNPLTDDLRNFVKENVPALVVEPINSLLGMIDATPIPGHDSFSGISAEGVTATANVFPTPTIFLSPTGTFTPGATVTFAVTPTVTMTPTVSMTPAAQTCLTLTTPANGAVLPAQGNVLFSWSAMRNAAKYEIVFTAPDKTWSKYTLTRTTYDFPIGTLISSGTYTWTVSAYNAAGKLICTAVEFKFKKDVSSTPTPTSTLTLVPTNTPSGTGTFLPPTDTYTGAGNTIFSAASGPSGTVTDCAAGVSFSVTVTDPDGVNEVSVEYYWTGGDGPTTLSLDYIDADTWSTFIGSLSPGDYGWDFSASDNLGNYEIGPGGSFTCP